LVLLDDLYNSFVSSGQARNLGRRNAELLDESWPDSNEEDGRASKGDGLLRGHN
jgi:hypothetical protein